MALPQQYRDISYGRKNDSAECVYFDQMTPGTANAGNTYLGRAETPMFSVSGGLFEAGDTIEVELSAPSDCRVFYTTDMTDPTENSNRYTSPIRISSQTVLRVRAYKDGCMPSYMDTQSYLFEVKNGGGSVYTVSIVSDPYNLTSDEAGILVKGSGSKPNYNQVSGVFARHIRCIQPGSEPAAAITDASGAIRRLIAASTRVCVRLASMSFA